MLLRLVQNYPPVLRKSQFYAIIAAMNDLERQFFEHFPLGAEARERLFRYADLLREANSHFNLVAESTLPILWQRHFLDSAQLFPLLPKGRKIVLADMGSGAGFPGMVLAIMAADCGLGHKINLVESIGKKAGFLSQTAETLGLRDVAVHNARAESLPAAFADVITARAVKPLPELLGMAARLAKKDAVMLFPKGRNAVAELTEAAKCWTFRHEIFPSLSDDSGSVFRIKNLKAIFNHGQRRKRS